MAAQQQRLVTEFEAVLGRNQTAWSDQAKNLAQQSLNGSLRAARDSTALLLEEAARSNASAVRSTVQEGIQRLEQALAVSGRIATWSLVASILALAASLCAILAHVLH
jgi:Transcriptional activator TraM